MKADNNSHVLLGDVVMAQKKPSPGFRRKAKPTKKQSRQEEALEEGLRETFPASDAVAATEPVARRSDRSKTRAARRLRAT
jgi:hypothetical protein